MVAEDRVITTSQGWPVAVSRVTPSINREEVLPRLQIVYSVVEPKDELAPIHEKMLWEELVIKAPKVYDACVAAVYDTQAIFITTMMITIMQLHMGHVQLSISGFPGAGRTYAAALVTIFFCTDWQFKLTLDSVCQSSSQFRH